MKTTVIASCPLLNIESASFVVDSNAQIEIGDMVYNPNSNEVFTTQFPEECRIYGELLVISCEDDRYNI